jgi:hypothetical protein
VGYRPDLPKYKLRFADHPGLEVVTKRVTVDGLMEFIGLAEGLDKVNSEHASPEDLKRVGQLFSRFAGVLVSWNVEDEDGQPVPPTREGIGSQDFQFVMEIITSWITEISSAPPPLPGNSSGPPEASIPMESLPSSPGPG